MNRNLMMGMSIVAVLGILGISLASAGYFGGLSEEDKAMKEEHREVVRTAVEAGDYASWEAAMQEKLAYMEDKITPEEFAERQTKHAERAEFRAAMMEARESGDFEAVKELKEQYGIEGMKGSGFGKGMHMKGSGQGFDGECPFMSEE